MDTINEIKRQELPEEQEIDLIELAQKLWKERKFLLKGCGIAVVTNLNLEIKLETKKVRLKITALFL